MNVKEFAEKTGFVIITGQKCEAKEVTGVYACDLLSRVMARAEEGNAWVTIHTHVNVVAVAVLNGLSCIIIPEDIKVEESTLKKAEEEGICLLSTGMGACEICSTASKALGIYQTL